METHLDPATDQLDVGDVDATQGKNTGMRDLRCQGLVLINKARPSIKRAWQYIGVRGFTDTLRARVTCRSPRLQAVSECP